MDLKVTTAVATGLKDEDRKRDILMNARVHAAVRLGVNEGGPVG
jgi:hypothetical protein